MGIEFVAAFPRVLADRFPTGRLGRSRKLARLTVLPIRLTEKWTSTPHANSQTAARPEFVRVCAQSHWQTR